MDSVSVSTADAEGELILLFVSVDVFRFVFDSSSVDDFGFVDASSERNIVLKDLKGIHFKHHSIRFRGNQKPDSEANWSVDTIGLVHS